MAKRQMPNLGPAKGRQNDTKAGALEDVAPAGKPGKKGEAVKAKKGKRG